MKRSLCILLAITAAGLAGCSKSVERGGPNPVRISPTMMRVTDLNFEAGDCIGLTIQRGLENYAENVMMTYNGSEFAASGLVWYSGMDDLSTLTAYYPYLKAGVASEFAVSAEQQSSSNFAASDLLAAVKTEMKPATSAVKMLFHHLFSRVSVLITNTTESKITGVTIGGSIPVATIDFAALKATAKSGTASVVIKASEVTPNACYRVVLVPQQAALVVTVFTDDGESRSKTIPVATLDGGKMYDVSVAVSNTDLEVALSGEIKDWIDGGSLDGDEEPGGDDGNSITYQNETYKIKKIGDNTWMAENLRYVPDQSLMGNGVWYPCKAGEAGSDPAYVRERGMLYSSAVAMAGGSGPSVQGICPPGWHVPSHNELLQLAGTSLDFFTLCGFWNSSLGNYGPDTKGYLVSAENTEDKNMVYCLNVTNTNIMSLPVGHGLSLRCVKDVVVK